MDTLYIKTTLDISVLQSERSQVRFSRKPRYNKNVGFIWRKTHGDINQFKLTSEKTICKFFLSIEAQRIIQIKLFTKSETKTDANKKFVTHCKFMYS